MSEDRKSSTRRYFDLYGGDYARLYAGGLARYPSGPIRMEKALRLLTAHAPAGRILDVGCGTGQLLAELLGRGYDAVGVDISAEMLRAAADTLTEHGADARGRLLEGDVESLPFADESFDAITALGVLEYLDADGVALAEIHRVLRPSGAAVIAFRNRLFNLFSLNDYTQQELADGTLAGLLAEFQELAGAADAQLDRLAEAELELPVRPRAEEPSGPEPARVLPIALRQHTPREALAAAAEHGLERTALLYFHFHAFPPLFERSDPQTYNRLGLRLEPLEASPIGSILASGFVAAFVRR